MEHLSVSGNRAAMAFICKTFRKEQSTSGFSFRRCHLLSIYPTISPSSYASGVTSKILAFLLIYLTRVKKIHCEIYTVDKKKMI